MIYFCVSYFLGDVCRNQATDTEGVLVVKVIGPKPDDRIMRKY